MNAKKQSVTCDRKLLVSGSRVTSKVIAVNVKPQNRASTCTANDSNASQDE